MAIQYAGGTNVNTTFNAGTRREIVDGIVAALTTAGWSTTSGGGTGDVVMESATTVGGHKIRFRFLDPGASTCAEVYLRNDSGDRVSQSFVLLYGVGKVYRIIANRYQFFVFTAGQSLAREFVAGGTGYIPAFLAGSTDPYFGWVQGNAQTSGDTQARVCFRYALSSVQGVSMPPGASTWGLWSSLVNGTIVNYSTASIAAMEIAACGAANFGFAPNGYQWRDDSYAMVDALMAWGLTNASVAKIQCLMYDAMVVLKEYPADATITFDSKTWFAITHNNIGNGGNAIGTLFVVVP